MFAGLYNVFSLLYFLCFPLWIPAAIGLYLLTSRRNEFSNMAGVLTLKPIITTPVWVAIISFLYDSGAQSQRIALWSILPGAGLTVLAIVIFRRLFLSLSPRFILAVLLILLDCMRWINSGLLTVTIALPYNGANNRWGNLFVLIGLIFPSAYSIVAFVTTLVASKVQTVD